MYRHTALHNGTYRYIAHRRISTFVDKYKQLSRTIDNIYILIHPDRCRHMSIYRCMTVQIYTYCHLNTPTSQRKGALDKGPYAGLGQSEKSRACAPHLWFLQVLKLPSVTRICIKVPGRYVQKSSHTPTRYCQRSSDRELAQLTVAWDGCHPWVCQNRGWTGADNIDTYRHIRTTIRTWGLRMLIAVESYR